MLNHQIKYKGFKPYESTYKKTNKNDTPLLSELHLDGVKKHSTAPKRPIEKLYEFPSAKSKKRGITRYDLRYTTGIMPDFNYKPTDITEVDEMEILDNYHLPKVDANIRYASLKPMSFKQAQLNNMKEELGIPNPLTALRVEATEGIPINEYKEKVEEKANEIMDSFESYKKDIIANKHIDEDGKRTVINSMEKLKAYGLTHPHKDGIFENPYPEETKKAEKIMEKAENRKNTILQIEKASNILKPVKTKQNQSSNNSNDTQEEKERIRNNALSQIREKEVETPLNQEEDDIEKEYQERQERKRKLMEEVKKAEEKEGIKDIFDDVFDKVFEEVDKKERNKYKAKLIDDLSKNTESKRGLDRIAEEKIQREENPAKYSMKDKKTELKQTRQELKNLLNSEIETPQQVAELNKTRKKVINLYNAINNQDEDYTEGLYDSLKNDYENFVSELSSNNEVLDAETLAKVNKYLLLSGLDHHPKLKGTTAYTKLNKPLVKSNFRKQGLETKAQPKEPAKARIMTISDLKQKEGKEEQANTNTKTKTK